MIFTGQRPDVPALMASMDVMAVPSLNEGFGRVIIEAGALGVPVVGANAAGIPEVIEEGVTGLMVPPRDDGALADAIVRLLDDDALRKRMAVVAPTRVRERFDPTRQVATLQRLWAGCRGPGRDQLPWMASS